jgi:hypothetical protein
MENVYQTGIDILSWLLIRGASVVAAFIIVMASIGPGWPKWKNVVLGWERLKWFIAYQTRAIKRVRKRWPQARLELLLVPAKKKKEIALVLLFEVMASISLPIILTWLLGPSPGFFLSYVYLPFLFLVANLTFLLRFLAGDEDEDGGAAPKPTDPGPVGQLARKHPLVLRVQQISVAKKQHSPERK